MSLRPIGGIFLRLDSSGNLNVYDTSGTVVLKLIGGVISGVQARGTPGTNSAVLTNATATLNYVGVGVVITPLVSTKVLIYCVGRASNNTGGDGVGIQINQNVGNSVHAGGGAAAGTALNGIAYTGLSANSATPFAIMVEATGLTPGTNYVFDLCLQALTGGTATIVVNDQVHCFEM